jgi:hypothetical protein
MNSVPATMMGNRVYNETSTTTMVNKKHNNLLAKVIPQRTVQLIGKLGMHLHCSFHTKCL